MRSWIGAPLWAFEAQYKTNVDSKKFISQNNDIIIYRYVATRQCYIYWHVNKDGIIVDFHHEGKGCIQPMF